MSINEDQSGSLINLNKYRFEKAEKTRKRGTEYILNRNGFQFFDKKSNRITMTQWMKLRKDPEYTCIRTDYVEEYVIRTTWCGNDRVTNGRAPRIYETIIFGPRNNGKTWKYATVEDALILHKKLIIHIENQ